METPEKKVQNEKNVQNASAWKDVFDVLTLENSTISQDLKVFREKRKEKMKGIGYEEKNQIIKMADKIPVSIYERPDWTKIIKIEVLWKSYKLCFPSIGKNTDWYVWKKKQPISFKETEEIDKTAISWDDPKWWLDKKLAEYLEDFNDEWFKIPNLDDIHFLLNDLWKEAWLCHRTDQIAMLMYLTGMEWEYYLTNWKKFLNETVWNWEKYTKLFRYKLNYNESVRMITDVETLVDHAQFIMMSCE